MVGLLAQRLELMKKAASHLLVVCDIVFYEEPGLVSGVEIRGVIFLYCRDSVYLVHVICVHVVLEVLVQRTDYLVVSGDSLLWV